jgi:hypothetical protein
MKRLILSIAIGLATTTSAYANVSSENASKAEGIKIEIQHANKMAIAATDCSTYEGISRKNSQGIRKHPDGTCEFYMGQKVGELEGDYFCPLSDKLMKLAVKHYKNKVLFFKGEAEYNNNFGRELECVFVADVDADAIANTKEFNNKKLEKETADQLAESVKLSKLHSEKFKKVKEKEMSDLKSEKEKSLQAEKREKMLEAAMPKDGVSAPLDDSAKKK